MTGIDLNGMTFTCGKHIHNIAFDPPLKSYAETRERVVQMDKECLQALGRSDITIKEFAPPTGLYAVEFVVIIAFFLSYSQRWWFARGEVVERFLGPSFASFSWNIQPLLFNFCVVLHAAEMFYFMQYRLRKHSVDMASSVWWLWSATTFFEGLFAFYRFSNLVKKKLEAKDKQKH